jgi:hypothetical protein
MGSVLAKVNEWLWAGKKCGEGCSIVNGKLFNSFKEMYMHRIGINVERRKPQMTNTQLGSPTFPSGLLSICIQSSSNTTSIRPQLIVFMPFMWVCAGVYTD